MAGTGAGSGYAAAAATLQRGPLEVKALYAWNPGRFRRAEIPGPVQTESERENLMFRVKIQLPKELGLQYVERIKTGIRGVGYVKIKDSAVWPKRLQNLIGPPPQATR